MAARIRIFGVQGGLTGEKQAARLFLPAGQTLSADVVLSAPVWTFTMGGTFVDIPLTEVAVSVMFGCDVTATPAPPDSVMLGYEYAVCVLPGGTDMTSQVAVTAALTAALAAANTTRRFRQLYTQMGGPFLKNGVWTDVLPGTIGGGNNETFNESSETVTP